MKILHLASFDRWTGAAAPAFSEVEALRRAGLEAHYGYVGGGGLERKIGHLPFTHAIVRREADPLSVARAGGAIRRFVLSEGFDVVHVHLTHDHWLGRIATRGLAGPRLVRTFHSERTLRRDPVTRWLLRGTQGVCVINEDFVRSAAIARFKPLYTPPPVDERLFRPGPSVREAYGVAPGEPLLGFIGKVDRGRGFEAAMDVLVEVRRTRSDARLLIIGHGPLRPALEARARRLGIDGAVIWAGYHERELAEHLRAPDLMLFTARGSDEGHRAVVEAMACGTPVAAWPIAGVRALYGPLADRLVAGEASVAALASVCDAVLSGRAGVGQDECVDATARSRYAPAAARLAEFYAALPPGRAKPLG
ncbi:MAG TPA: glycosyltransferase [Thermoanaerobaculia bacterium]|nr:glycosyltransferase [Thermoanaerobaculia bacterium]